MADWIWIAATVAGIVGMAACLYGMYGSPSGFRAVTAIDPEFKSLDMRRRYTPAEVFDCFDKLSQQGQRILQRLWKLDFVFIFFFFLVMVVASRNVARWQWMFPVMATLALLRGMADIMENILLLRVCGAYPARRLESAAKAAGAATGIKWVLMGLWVAALFVNLIAGAV